MAVYSLESAIDMNDRTGFVLDVSVSRYQHAAHAGEAHSAALTSNGFVFTWGSNDKGQLGLPAAADVAQQMQVRYKTK